MKDLLLIVLTVYLLGLFIWSITFGLIIYDEEKFRDALVFNLLYPIWFLIMTLYVLTITIRAFIKNETFEESTKVIHEVFGRNKLLNKWFGE